MNKLFTICSVALIAIAWSQPSHGFYVNGLMRNVLKSANLSRSDRDSLKKIYEVAAIGFSQKYSLDELVQFYSDTITQIRKDVVKYFTRDKYDLAALALLPAIIKKLETTTEWKSKDNSHLINKLKSSMEKAKQIHAIPDPEVQDKSSQFIPLTTKIIDRLENESKAADNSPNSLMDILFSLFD